MTNMNKTPKTWVTHFELDLSEQMFKRVQKYRFFKLGKKKRTIERTLYSLINQALKHNGY